MYHPLWTFTESKGDEMAEAEENASPAVHRIKESTLNGLFVSLRELGWNGHAEPQSVCEHGPTVIAKLGEKPLSRIGSEGQCHTMVAPDSILPDRRVDLLRIRHKELAQRFTSMEIESQQALLIAARAYIWREDATELHVHYRLGAVEKADDACAMVAPR